MQVNTLIPQIRITQTILYKVNSVEEALRHATSVKEKNKQKNKLLFPKKTPFINITYSYPHL